MICPRCGAENQPSAKICRMCATPLEPVNPMASAPKSPYPPGMGMPPMGTLNPKPIVSPPTGNSAGPGELLCPTCKAVNDATWAYCQQCGSQLHKMGVPKPAAQSAPITPLVSPMAPIAPMPPMSQAPAPIMAPNKQPIAAPAVLAPKPIAVPAMEVVSRVVGNNAVINCPSCGRINTPGSSFCATCGSALPGLEQAAIASSRGVTPKLRLIQEGGGDGEIYKLDTDETIIGRNNGDIRFPHDGYMSGRHARIIRRGEHFVLVDENSRNGTFKRIDGEVELKAGDIILIGKQLFRFEL